MKTFPEYTAFFILMAFGTIGVAHLCPYLANYIQNEWLVALGVAIVSTSIFFAHDQRAHKRAPKAQETKAKQVQNDRVDQVTTALMACVSKLRKKTYFGDKALPKMSDDDYASFVVSREQAHTVIWHTVNANRETFQRHLDFSGTQLESLMAVLIAKGSASSTPYCIHNRLLNLCNAYLNAKLTVAFLSQTGSDRSIESLDSYLRVNKAVSCCQSFITVLRAKYLDTDVQYPNPAKYMTGNIIDLAKETLQKQGVAGAALPTRIVLADFNDPMVRSLEQLIDLTQELFLTDAYLCGQEPTKTTEELEEFLAMVNGHCTRVNPQ